MKRRFDFEAALELMIASAVVFFAVWTLSYQLVLAARWPAVAVFYVLAAVLVVTGAVILLFFRGKSSQPSQPDSSRAAVFAVLLLGLACAVASLVVCRPDADDIGFYHRLMVQVQTLDAPVILGDTTHNVTGLPGLTSMHLMASYETLVAFLAHVAGLDSLSLFQNGACAVAAFLVPLVYFLLARRLDLSPFLSFLTALGAVFFLWLDGNTHASFGNFSFVRLWHGKCILMTLGTPLLALYTMRFWKTPAASEWMLLFCACVSSVGLSGTGLFFAPVVVFLVSLALIASVMADSPRTFAQHLRKFFVLNAASAYCVLLVLALLTGIIPMLRDVRNAPDVIWHTESWWANLSYATGPPTSVVFYSALLLVAPWLALPPRKARLVVFWSLAAAILCFTPLSGPLWLKAVMTVYWRLLFALPVALCAGLAVAGLVLLCKSGLGKTLEWIRLAALVLLAGTFIAHFRMATFSPANGAFLKKPFEYRFDPPVLSFCRLAAPHIAGRNLLAPSEIAAALPLLSTTVRLETQRPWVTRGFFRDAGKNDEAVRRIASQSFVTASGKRKPGAAEAFDGSIENGVDALIVENMALPEVIARLRSMSGTWRESAGNEDYALLLKM